MEWFESLWTDLRYALRTFRRTPMFTAVATITLALGIGATTAMFTLVNSILLRPLPYPEADRIVRIIQSYPEKGLDTWGLNQQNIVYYRDINLGIAVALEGGLIVPVIRNADEKNVAGLQRSIVDLATRARSRHRLPIIPKSASLET